MALGVAMTLAVPAFAQKKDAETKEYDFNRASAKAHVLEARRTEARKDWKIAAKEYGIAYHITQDPGLFFYMAFAYISGGDCDAALIYYRRYIAESKPTSADAAAKENHNRSIEASQKYIKQCEARLGIKPVEDPKKDPAVAPPDPTDPPDPVLDPAIDPALDPSLNPIVSQEIITTDDEPSWKRTVAWTALGVGAAFATTGAVLGLAAKNREDDISRLQSFRDSMMLPSTYDGATRRDFEDLDDEGKQLETFSIVAFGAAGAAAALAITFFILDGLSDDVSNTTAASSAKAKIAPTVTTDSVGVTAGWEF